VHDEVELATLVQLGVEAGSDIGGEVEGRRLEVGIDGDCADRPKN
jgi:hypothetical protein